MGMDASAKLVYGIDFGDERPDFLGDYKGDLYDWAEEKEQAKVMKPVYYMFEGDTILAVKGYSHAADYSVKEITSFDVDPIKEEAFKEALRAAGVENPQPKWLLAVRVSF
jgi:hypothetical protein